MTNSRAEVEAARERLQTWALGVGPLPFRPVDAAIIDAHIEAVEELVMDLRDYAVALEHLVPRGIAKPNGAPLGERIARLRIAALLPEARE